MKKRSQITLFIILGLFILVAGIFAVTLLNIQKDPVKAQIDERYALKDSVEPVRIYVESCLHDVSSLPVTEIGNMGGSLHPIYYREYGNKTVQYLCLEQDSGYGSCSNAILTKAQMQDELAKEIEEKLLGCLSLDVFEVQGFSVQKGELDVNVSVYDGYVDIAAYYPLTLKKNQTEFTIDTFNIRISSPLGLLFKAGNHILNKELEDGWFDQAEFMRSHADLISVEKHRPYPDIIYMLEKEGYGFNFAIEGKDTVSASDYGSYGSLESLGSVFEGCCYMAEGGCYKSSGRKLCEDKGGIYDPSPGCGCSEPAFFGSRLCNGMECKNCESTYNPVTGKDDGYERQHGESWCVYEGPTGKGSDHVGSRHYVHYCIDGKEYVEECRDYREELCVERTADIGGVEINEARCRANMWQDCNICQTKECCLDDLSRDCFWIDDIGLGRQCLPEVPPGMKFWQDMGQEVCSIASEDKLCSGLSCGSDWLTASARMCSMHGDCGYGFNYEGDRSLEGFYYVDFQASAKKEEAMGSGSAHLGQKLDVSFETTGKRLLGDPEMLGADNLMRILVSFYSFLDQLSHLSVSDIASNREDINFMGVTICDLWKPSPGSNNCERCSDNDIHPCTEYKCMSLGPQCIYEEKGGIGSCHIAALSDKSAPIISLGEDKSNQGYDFHEKTIDLGWGGISGFEIKEPMMPYRVLSFNISTQKDTICRASFFPDEGIVKGYYVSQEGFAKDHMIRLKVPAKPQFPKRLLDIFNASDKGSLLESIRQGPNMTSFSGQKDEVLSKIYNKILGIQGIDDASLDKASGFIRLLFSDADRNIKAMEKIFEKIDEGGYYLFFSCSDRAGKKNEKEFFIEVNIDDLRNDKSPPAILGFEPENSTFYSADSDKVHLKLYLNEPGECRYDAEDREYDDMSGEFSCTYSNYEISPEFGGSYLCYGVIDAPADNLGIYIRCKDNPQTYSENVFEMAIKNASAKDQTFMVNRQTLQENHIEAYPGNITLEFFMDDFLECEAAYSSGKQSVGACGKSGHMQLGLYSCIFNLSIGKEAGTNYTQSINSTDNANNLTNHTSTSLINDTSSDLSQDVPGESNNLDSGLEYNLGMMENVTVSILCKEQNISERNVNKRPFFFSLQRSESLQITDFGPSGDVISAEPFIFAETTQSSGTKCGYFKEFILGTTRMQKVEENKFSAALDDAFPGQNTYYIYCSDDYGNEARQQVNFYVLE